jgi:hypothetical protein
VGTAVPRTQEQLNQREKVFGAIEKLESLINKIAKERRLQCMAAIANEPICECLGQKLPMVINFVQYVAIVTQTRDELNAGQESENRQARKTSVLWLSPVAAT